MNGLREGARPAVFAFERDGVGAVALVFADSALREILQETDALTDAFWRAVDIESRETIATELSGAFDTGAWRSTLRLFEESFDVSAEMDGAGRLVGAFTPLMQAFDAVTERFGGWMWRSSAEGLLLELSDGYERLVKEPKSVITGLRRDDIALSYDDPGARLASAAIGARQPFRGMKYQRRTTDGRVIWVASDGEPLFGVDGAFQGYYGCARDVTAEMDMNTHRALLSAVLGHAPVGLLLVNGDGQIVYFNAEFSRLLGAAADVMSPGAYFRDFLASAADSWRSQAEYDHEEGWVERRIKALNVRPMEAEYYIGDTWVEFRSTPLVQGGFVIAAIDIDDRRRLQEQLVHSQRLEATGRLTAGVAHDFNNLLAIIMGNLELLELSELGEVQADLAESALAATQRGALLTRQLLAFGRRAPLSPKVIEANAVIEEMRPLFDRTLPASITVSTELDPSLATTRIDRGQLETALLNLVINARDAMTDGGALSIETRNAILDEGDVGVGKDALAPGPYVTIAVRDDGVGMARDVAAMAFEPFFTTKAVGEGSGLGLSMVFGFAKQSGGDVRIESAPDHGATIRLYFPASAEMSGQAATPPPRAPVKKLSRLVLLVEDSDAVRQTARRQLEHLGCRVEEAATAEIAFARLEVGPPIDILLTDIVLPGAMQGPALAAEARRMRPDLPIIFVSGYPRAAIGREGALPEGAQILAKPFSTAHLSDALDAASTGADEP